MTLDETAIAADVGHDPVSVVIVAPPGRWARVVAADIRQQLEARGHEAVVLHGPSRSTAGSSRDPVVLQFGPVSARAIAIALELGAPLIQTPLDSADVAVAAVVGRGELTSAQRPLLEVTGQGHRPLLLHEPIGIEGGDLDLDLAWHGRGVSTERVQTDAVTVSPASETAVLAHEPDGRRWDDLAEVRVRGRRGLRIEIEGARHPTDIVTIRPHPTTLTMAGLPSAPARW